MASDLVLRRDTMQQLMERRKPDLQTLAASNRQPEPADYIPISQRRTILTVERTNCRWPIGDPRQDGFYLCGGRTSDSDSYCARHMQIAYQPAFKPARTTRT